MSKEKTEAYYDFLKGVRRSWTWGRLTPDERGRFVSNIFEDDFKGSYEQRKQGYMQCYMFYLYGLGYNDSPTWRAGEPEEENPLF